MNGKPKAPVDESMADIHRTVRVPEGQWWRRVFAFTGPAYMVAVGYMDPGNWATDLEGGARFGYRLLWILLLSNMAAVLLQTLSARLGLVTGRDLAQACRDAYGPVVRWVLFVLCELAITACDLAEVLGTAIGLNLLTGVPISIAVLATGFDVLLLLGMQRWGIRKLEGVILALISTIGLCFVIEVFLCKPSVGGIAGGFVPRSLSGGELYVAIGILGATVMPHNLYLHSSLVQSRIVNRSRIGVAEACRFNLIDSVVALNGAFLVNAAILVVAAASFWTRGIEVTELQQAHSLLEGVLGNRIAPVAFALALICAGQSSTVTGTLAGQITMEGFLHFRMRPWLRRFISRAMAIVPAMAVILIMGDGAVYDLLVFSQVVLSLQLPFAVLPLVRFTNSRLRMGPFASPKPVKIIAWVVALLIVGLNAKLVLETLWSWGETVGPHRYVVWFIAIPVAVALGGLLVWIALKREEVKAVVRTVTPDAIFRMATGGKGPFRRIGLALETGNTDAAVLAEGIALAKANGAELILLHVVEGVGGQWYGPQTGDAESRHDEDYLGTLARKIRSDFSMEEVPDIRTVLGYGDVVRELSRLAEREDLDLIIMGSHGHRGLRGVLQGQTISGVRHTIHIPLLAVPPAD